MTNCVGCHTLQRVFASTHDADEFKQVFKRMGSYSPGSTPLQPQPLLPGPRADRSPMPQSQFDVMSAWLAGINLSKGDERSYELATLPRPKGEATKVIITEYDLPRKDAEPHDVIVDQDGAVWYSDFGNQFVGVLDPKTGKADRHSDPGAEAGRTQGRSRSRVRPRAKERVAGDDVSGRPRQDRSADPCGDDLSVPEGVAVALHAGLDGLAPA